MTDAGKVQRINITSLEKAKIVQYAHDYQLEGQVRTRASDTNVIEVATIDFNDALMIKYVRDKFLSYYSNTSRAFHLVSTIKHRIKEYVENIGKGPKQAVKRTRAETADAKEKRLKKEAALAIAGERDAAKQRDIDEVEAIREDLVSRGRVLISQAEDLTAIDVVLDSLSGTFLDCYKNIDAIRMKLVPHINLDNDCATTYLSILHCAKRVYAKGYDEKWEWALELRNEK